VLHSHVGNVDINISLEVLARVLHLLCEGTGIFHFNLEDFEYPVGETPLTAFQLLHINDNSALVKNKEVKYCTPLPKF